MASHLLKAGVDPGLRDDRGKDAAMIAEELGHAETARLIRTAQGRNVR